MLLNKKNIWLGKKVLIELEIIQEKQETTFGWDFFEEEKNIVTVEKKGNYFFFEETYSFEGNKFLKDLNLEIKGNLSFEENLEQLKAKNVIKNFKIENIIDSNVCYLYHPCGKTIGKNTESIINSKTGNAFTIPKDFFQYLMKKGIIILPHATK